MVLQFLTFDDSYSPRLDPDAVLGVHSCFAVPATTTATVAPWSWTEEEKTGWTQGWPWSWGDSPVDWLKAGAIETTQSPLFSYGKGKFCILYTRVTFSFYHTRLIQGEELTMCSTTTNPSPEKGHFTDSQAIILASGVLRMSVVR